MIFFSHVKSFKIRSNKTKQLLNCYIYYIKWFVNRFRYSKVILFKLLFNCIIFLDSKIILLLNGKQISPLEIDDTFKEIETLNNFQILLDKVNITKCCQGAIIANQNANIRASFGAQYVKSSGQWWHSNCLTIIKEAVKLYNQITFKIGKLIQLIQK